MKKLLTLVAVAAVMIATSSQAAATHFDGGAGPGDPNWNNATNWIDDLVPTGSTDVKALDVNLGYGVEINNPGALALSVDVGTWGWPGKLTVAPSGTLSVAANFAVAQQVGLPGTVTNNGQITADASVILAGGIGSLVNNGTITAVDMIIGQVATSTSTVVNTGVINLSGWFYLSLAGQESLFNMDGGNLNTASFVMQPGGAGHMNLNGGVITNAALALQGDGNYTIEVDNGEMYSAGDYTNGMQWMISVGLITGKGSKIAYSSFDGTYTKLGAIPEPATIALVSLLGLALLRRK
jgi:hypothetical protein